MARGGVNRTGKSARFDSQRRISIPQRDGEGVGWCRQREITVTRRTPVTPSCSNARNESRFFYSLNA
jgi:hypothetical protein